MHTACPERHTFLIVELMCERGASSRVGPSAERVHKYTQEHKEEQHRKHTAGVAHESEAKDDEDERHEEEEGKEEKEEEEEADSTEEVEEEENKGSDDSVKEEWVEAAEESDEEEEEDDEAAAAATAVEEGLLAEDAWQRAESMNTARHWERDTSAASASACGGSAGNERARNKRMCVCTLKRGQGKEAAVCLWRVV